MRPPEDLDSLLTHHVLEPADQPQGSLINTSGRSVQRHNVAGYSSMALGHARIADDAGAAVNTSLMHLLTCSLLCMTVSEKAGTPPSKAVCQNPNDSMSHSHCSDVQTLAIELHGHGIMHIPGLMAMR